MARNARHWFVAAASVFWAATAAAEPPKTLDADVAALMQGGGTPGLALGIVEKGKTVLAKGYGVRELGKPDPVDAGTLFEIGSTTKAFTSAALAILSENGKLDWDDRVIDHLPEFQMYDPYVTREFTIRDLLTHRSGLGLGAGDMTFDPRTDRPRTDMLKALRWLKPQTSFRSQFAYDNLLYVVAGLLIERETGQRWEDFMRERILRPVGMTTSTTDEPSRYLVADRAQGHARLGPPFRGVGAQTVLDEHLSLSPNVYPAGGIMSNADEMSRWIAVQLAHGKLPDGTRRLWSDKSALEMWKPVTPLPPSAPSGPLAATASQFREYALGWFLMDYKGHKVITHTGGSLGFLTHVVLLPDQDVGFVIMQNSEDAEVFNALEYRLLDHYLGLPPTDWGQAFRDSRDLQIKAGRARLAAAQTPARKRPATLEPSQLAGAYADNWYGPMTIALEAGKPVITLPRSRGMVAELEPYNGDTYIARWRDPTVEPAYVAFASEDGATVSHVTMKAVSPLADFSLDYQDLDFTPVRPKH